MICFWTWSRGKKTMQTRHWCKCLTNIWENLKWLLNIIFSYFPRDHVRGWLEYLPIDRKAHERVRDQVRKMIMINMNLFVQFSVASPSSLVALYLMCHSYCCWPSPPDGIWGPPCCKMEKMTNAMHMIFLLRLYWVTFIAIITIMGGLGSCRMTFSLQEKVMFGDFKDFSREPELVCNLIFSSKIEFLPWRRQ